MNDQYPYIEVTNRKKQLEICNRVFHPWEFLGVTLDQIKRKRNILFLESNSYEYFSKNGMGHSRICVVFPFKKIGSYTYVAVLYNHFFEDIAGFVESHNGLIIFKTADFSHDKQNIHEQLFVWHKIFETNDHIEIIIDDPYPKHQKPSVHIKCKFTTTPYFTELMRTLVSLQ